jgi:ribulose-5-phosphate 4-epimerase/fuculose-1-phosphate aldolase
MNKPVVQLRSGEDAERQLRIDLAAAYRLAAHFGMDDLIYTHFSARLADGSGDFLLNPYGLMFDEITASSLIRVTPRGEVVGRTEFDLNEFGYKIHEPFYRLRPDIGCVLHTHTRAGIAVSTMECGLLPLSQMAMHFYGDALGYHAYEGNAFRADEQERLIANLGNAKSVMLRNHGLLTVGGSVAEAFSYMYYLEQCCRIQVDAMASGAKLIQVPHEVAAGMNAQYRQLKMPFSKREWPALLRLMDRKDPSYRE